MKRPLRLRPRTLEKVYLPNLSFKGVPRDVLKKKVGHLNLDNRTINILSAHNIRNVGELIAATRVGLVFVSAKKSAEEVREALSALNESADGKLGVNWIDYTKRRGLVMLPRNCRASCINEFRTAARDAVRIRYGHVGLLIFDHRLSVERRSRMTLEKLGESLGRTRENTRKNEKSVLTMLRNTILHGDFGGCRFRFHPAFLQTLGDLAAKLERQAERVLSAKDWDKMIAAWSGSQAALGPEKNLLAAIFGLRVTQISSRRSSEVLVIKETDATLVGAVARIIGQLLTREFAQGLSPRQLQLRVAEKTRTPISLSGLHAVVRSLKSVQFDSDTGRYRARRGCLRFGEDDFEQLLRAEARPMHITEIAAKSPWVRRRTARLGSIRTLLSKSPRFTHIGRSGYWVLTAWKGIETRTVADIAAELMRNCRGPMTEKDLFKVISKRRPVSVESMWKLLAQDPRFKRVRPATWGLAEPI